MSILTNTANLTATPFSPRDTANEKPSKTSKPSEINVFDLIRGNQANATKFFSQPIEEEFDVLQMPGTTVLVEESAVLVD